LAANAAFVTGGFSPMVGPALAGLQTADPLAAMPSQSSDPNAPMIQTRTQTGDFVIAPVDDAKITVPAGYKQKGRQK
jgi:hypothetical protein